VVDGMTGAFFFEPTADALIAAVRGFDQASYDPATIRSHAEQFSQQRFLREMDEFVQRVLTAT